MGAGGCGGSARTRKVRPADGGRAPQELHGEGPRTLKVALVARLVGLGERVAHVPGFKFGVTNKAAEYLAWNPLGKAPVLRLPGGAGAVYESNAIARYLCQLRPNALYPEAGPAGALRAAQIDAWVDWSMHLDTRVHKQLYRMVRGLAEYDAAAYDQALAELLEALQKLEAHLASRTWLVGEALTLADVLCACSLWNMFHMVLDGPKRKALPQATRWWTACMAHPDFAAVYGKYRLCAKEQRPAGPPGKRPGKKPAAAAGAPPSPELAAAEAAAAAQGAKVKALKERGAAKEEVAAEVAVLKDLKAQMVALGGSAGGGGRPKKEKKKPAEKKKDKPKKEKKDKPAPPSKGAGKQEKKKVTKLGLQVSKDEDFGEWYSELVVKAELISYYEISGCYILRPGAYEIWQAIYHWFDAEIKKLGVRNTYFPIFVPKSALEKEKDHVEGFAAEVAWVTKSGQSDLETPIAIRPTSETVMYPFYADWIRSHRDLPLKLNQWCNVVRWEFKHPTPFIRSREFLWQEGHTAFATKAEADAEVMQILDLYRGVYEDLLCVPVMKGVKSEKEKFAGGLYTTTVEAFIPATGKAIQGGTSHCLGQNFSKMFNIEFTAEDKTQKKVWQNSWGITTRTIGVMIMIHADNKGLVVPPRVAPTQAVIIPIPNSKMSAEQRQKMAEVVAEMDAALKAAGVRVHVDDRDFQTPGWKYSHWELKGVPLRIELGPKDLVAGHCVVARRDTGKKDFVKWGDLAPAVQGALAAMQTDMLAKARKQFDESIVRVTKWEDFVPALNAKKMVLAPWCEEVEVEEKVKQDSAAPGAAGAKTLCIPFDQPEMPAGTMCFAAPDKPAKRWTLWGRSY